MNFNHKFTHFLDYILKQILHNINMYSKSLYISHAERYLQQSKTQLNIFQLHFMHFFSADTTTFFEKMKNQNKFTPENMKKLTSKAAHNRPPTFFMYWRGCPNGPETEILYQQKPLNGGLGIQTGMLSLVCTCICLFQTRLSMSLCIISFSVCIKRYFMKDYFLFYLCRKVFYIKVLGYIFREEFQVPLLLF